MRKAQMAEKILSKLKWQKKFYLNKDLLNVTEVKTQT